MKVKYEATIEVNNQLKVNVDEQQDDNKLLKEQCKKMINIKFRKSQVLETP